jgi:hypothetical protein
VSKKENKSELTYWNFVAIDGLIKNQLEHDAISLSVSACPRLIFATRFMRCPCCLSVYRPLIFFVFCAVRVLSNTGDLSFPPSLLHFSYARLRKNEKQKELRHIGNIASSSIVTSVTWHRTAWYGPATVCRTALSVTVQEHSIAYCRCREAVELFRFLLSPYSLVGSCNSVQNCRETTWTFQSGLYL